MMMMMTIVDDDDNDDGLHSQIYLNSLNNRKDDQLIDQNPKP